MLSVLSHKAQAKGLPLFLDYDRACETDFIGDPGRIRQIMINLIGNALKFTYGGGEIIIRAYQIGSFKKARLRVEIVDTGIGIIDNYQQEIFQRFYRIENNVHTLKGTGLGLSISKTILLQHNTTIIGFLANLLSIKVLKLSQKKSWRKN